MSSFLGFDFEVQTTTIQSTGNRQESEVHRPSSPDPLNTWAPLRTHPSHRWTIEEQAVLCVLERWFISEKPAGQRLLSFHDINRIFGAYFSETIHFRGEGKDITDNAIRTQLYEVMHEHEDNIAWREVFIETDFLDSRNQWAATRGDLLATATQLGIKLLQKPFEDKFEILQPPSKKRRIHEARPWTNEVDKEAECTPYGLLTPRTPSASKTSGPRARSSSGRRKCSVSSSPVDGLAPQLPDDPKNLGTYLQTPSRSPRREVSRHTKRPMRKVTTYNNLLFRFYDENSQGINSSHGFTAGAFVGKESDVTKVTIPDMLTEEFLRPAETHLLRLHQPTPFISLYDSLLPALHRALRSSGNAFIAVIDAHYFETSAADGYQTVHWVGNVAEELLSRGRYGLRYLGATEWITYHSIPRDAVISTISIGSLRQYASAHSSLKKVLRLQGIEESVAWGQYSRHLKATAVDVDPSVGKAIGNFLNYIGIPEQYLDAMALRFAKVWRLRGWKNESRKIEYLEGIRRGFSKRTEGGAGVAQPRVFYKRQRKLEEALESSSAEEITIRKITAVAQPTRLSKRCRRVGEAFDSSSDDENFVRRTRAAWPKVSTERRRDLRKVASASSDDEFTLRRRKAVASLTKLRKRQCRPTWAFGTSADDDLTLQRMSVPSTNKTPHQRRLEREEAPVPVLADEFILRRRRIERILSGYGGGSGDSTVDEVEGGHMEC